MLWKEPNCAGVALAPEEPRVRRGVRLRPADRRPGAAGPRPARDGEDPPAAGRWLALVNDVYPAYITWEEHEQILATIEENRQKMAERLMRKQAIRGGAALLTGLVRCGRCGHAMHVAYKENRFQYICRTANSKYAQVNCQYLTGRPIDEAVVQEFFGVLQPAEIDALERVNAKQAEHRRELEHHLEQEVRRLEYAAHRAARQYDSVDPENRLIAATLEKRWEEALAELEQSQARLAELKAQSPQPVAIPSECARPSPTRAAGCRSCGTDSRSRPERPCFGRWWRAST